MNALTMTLIAMLLSTASARVLSEKPCGKYYQCDKDYQPPNYWGKCGPLEQCQHGDYNIYLNLEIDSDKTAPCRYLVLLVPEEVVGNKTLTIDITFNHGDSDDITQDLGLNEFGYYSLIIKQTFWYGPDVNITFFLDGTVVHKGRYQQNNCFMKSGDVWTDDPNAVTYEGDVYYDMPGHIIIKSFD